MTDPQLPPLKLVIFSDLHLVPEGEVSNTLDTHARLTAGIAHANAHHADADLVILAGDLADLAEPAAYARLKALTGTFAVTPQLMLGNHDARPTFLDCMGHHEADANGFVQKCFDIKGHRILLLDSTEPGLVGGRLCQTRLDWLAARLDEALDRPVILVLHHHVVPLRTDVDRIILQEGEALIATLRRHPQVRQVIAGHVHLTSVANYEGISFTTLAGAHYSVEPVLSGSARPERFRDGPAQYALVLSDERATVVHFEDWLPGGSEIAQANFYRERAPRR